VNDESLELFPYRHARVDLFVEGKLSEGGRGRLRNDETHTEEFYDFSPLQFVVLSILMRAALRAWRNNLPPTAAFVAKPDFQSELKRIYGLADPDRIVKDVWRLRQVFARRTRAGAALAAKDNGASNSLIEHTMLGWRVSIPPERLHLRVFDDVEDGV